MRVSVTTLPSSSSSSSSVQYTDNIVVMMYFFASKRKKEQCTPDAYKPRHFDQKKKKKTDHPSTAGNQIINNRWTVRLRSIVENRRRGFFSLLLFIYLYFFFLFVGLKIYIYVYVRIGVLHLNDSAPDCTHCPRNNLADQPARAHLYHVYTSTRLHCNSTKID